MTTTTATSWGPGALNAPAVASPSPSATAIEFRPTDHASSRVYPYRSPRVTLLAAAFDDPADAEAVAQTLAQHFGDALGHVLWGAASDPVQRRAVETSLSAAPSLRGGPRPATAIALGLTVVAALCAWTLPDNGRTEPVFVLLLLALAALVGQKALLIPSTRREAATRRWLRRQWRDGKSVVFVPDVPEGRASEMVATMSSFAPRWWGVSRH